MAEISRDVIKAYALENAIKYGGKANQGAVLSALFAEGLEKSKIKEILPKIKNLIKQVNSFSPQKQEEELEKLSIKTSKRVPREGLPELSNAIKDHVVMRFAPFPSGPLHIGNARTLILNEEYIKMYGGKLHLVMDDTIGSEKKPLVKEAYKLIEEGIQWFGVNYEKKIVYKSDRIEKYYEYANELIKKGYMYICTCEKEKVRNLRLKGIECSCRQHFLEEQLKKWKEMFTAPVGSMTVRLKTDMSDSDPAFRDRVMFRISERPHARHGKKYRVYPMLDFSAAIDDHYLGITHILRGMELTMETRVEKYIWDIFRWNHPEIIYNGHFEIEGIKISKSKGATEVKSGTYLGWNDPRGWSLQSLRDRGFSPDAIRKFIINMGLKKTNITVPIDVLYSLNRKELENVPRYFFVENPKKIKISGCPSFEEEIPLHPNGKAGKRTIKTDSEFFIPGTDYSLMRDTDYRLLHLLNFTSDQLLKLRPRTFSYLSKESNEKDKIKFLQWLPANAKNIKVKLRLPDASLVEGLGEESLKSLEIGTVVQFERVGFARLHKKEPDYLEFWFAHN